jgi:hypothetical protein
MASEEVDSHIKMKLPYCIDMESTQNERYSELLQWCYDNLGQRRFTVTGMGPTSIVTDLSMRGKWTFVGSRFYFADASVAATLKLTYG